jgi:hypothetical protein
VGNLLAQAALHDLDHYLTLPWAERFEVRPQRTQGLFILVPSTIAGEPKLERIDQVIITTWLGQRTFVSSPYTKMARERPSG